MFLFLCVCVFVFTGQTPETSSSSVDASLGPPASLPSLSPRSSPSTSQPGERYEIPPGRVAIVVQRTWDGNELQGTHRNWASRNILTECGSEGETAPELRGSCLCEQEQKVPTGCDEG